ncbi:vimentin-like [Megalops cyprinoides]|uniref:vimentin-like n=1 Tax=Megalops cyprinoides TaxID=118141 RepID=UPI001864352C|nr:vimentin-like [Megalops cyprinoides]
MGKGVHVVLVVRSNRILPHNKEPAFARGIAAARERFEVCVTLGCQRPVGREPTESKACHSHNSSSRTVFAWRAHPQALEKLPHSWTYLIFNSPPSLYLSPRPTPALLFACGPPGLLPIAMLRVSSYRRLFEDEHWGGLQLHSSARGEATEYQWGEPDFEAAHALNREALSRFKSERALIAALNDRLALLIDTARCLEEENESLEAQILQLEGRLSSAEAHASARGPDGGLEAVVERLRREKEQILLDIARLKGELELLQAQYEEAVEQRTLVNLEREDVALDVDALTAECLALKEQVAIYEEQLASMQVEQETSLGAVTPAATPVKKQRAARPEAVVSAAQMGPGLGAGRVSPRVTAEAKRGARRLSLALSASPPLTDILLCDQGAEGRVETVAEPAPVVSLVSLEFPSPDVTPAIHDLKDYFRQLAASLQAKAAVAITAGQPRAGEAAAALGVGLTGGPAAAEHDALMKQELQRELEELEQYFEELKEKIRQRRADHLEEMEELEGYMAELEQAQAELQAQMREQCADYEELLSEKMALDIEITAYRGLVEEEEERLHFL